MSPLWAILGTAALFAVFGLLARRGAACPAGESCDARERAGGCGACHLRPLPRESADEIR